MPAEVIVNMTFDENGINDTVGKTGWNNNAQIIHDTNDIMFEYYALFDKNPNKYIYSTRRDLFDLGNEDFTIECWFNRITGGSYLFALETDFGYGAYFHSTGIMAYYGARTANSWEWISGDTYWNQGNGIGHITIQPDTWYHLVYQRDGTTFRTLINDVVDVEIDIGTSSFIAKNEPIYLGRWGNNTFSDGVKIAKFKFVKGKYLYGGAIYNNVKVGN